MAISLILSACQLTGPDDEFDEGNVRIFTDQDTYTARCEGEGRTLRCDLVIIAILENRSNQLIYLDKSMPDSPQPTFGIEMTGDQNGMDSAYNLAWMCVGGVEPFKLHPFETRMDTLRIFGPTALQGPRHLGELTGTMRLSYGMYSCPDEDGFECLLPENVKKSTPFYVGITK